MRKTQSKPLEARHGKGTAWERHCMCELALRSVAVSLPPVGASRMVTDTSLHTHRSDRRIQSVVMKQSIGIYALVRNAASTFVDNNSSVGRNTAYVYYIEMSFWSLFQALGVKSP
jgi:hypothetical protein